VDRPRWNQDSSVNTLAAKFAALQAAAADAVRAHDAEVQLGDAELRAMLTAAVGSAKKVAGVEALYSREARTSPRAR
jgi:hypothetical protein